MQVGKDGRVHTTFGHNPSSLRLCSFDPNLQNIPRGGDEYAEMVKQMFVAPRGYTFWERDFSGIEAVLVGYFAGARDYVRLAKMDVHSFYTAYALHSLDGRISASDLPQLGWEDSRLAARLAEIKKEFKSERNNLYKHLVHGANYLQSPKGAQEHIFKTSGRVFDINLIRKVMNVYFDLFPEIRRWHTDLCNRVDGTRRHRGDDGDSRDPEGPWSFGVCFARNPFGYVHHFYNVLDWTYRGIDSNGKRLWEPSFGEDAKRLVSFLPQSTAAAIIKKSAKRLWHECPWVGQTLRLLIHDSILGECREEQLVECLETSDRVMSAPQEELPLDPSWNMGTHLSILTEAKQGRIWGEMH